VLRQLLIKQQNVSLLVLLKYIMQKREQIQLWINLKLVTLILHTLSGQMDQLLLLLQLTEQQELFQLLQIILRMELMIKPTI